MVPRLVKFVDVLTNWYVRMNRRRLKVSVCRLLLTGRHGGAVTVEKPERSQKRKECFQMLLVFEVLSLSPFYIASYLCHHLMDGNL